MVTERILGNRPTVAPGIPEDTVVSEERADILADIRTKFSDILDFASVDFFTVGDYLTLASEVKPVACTKPLYAGQPEEVQFTAYNKYSSYPGLEFRYIRHNVSTRKGKTVTEDHIDLILHQQENRGLALDQPYLFITWDGKPGKPLDRLCVHFMNGGKSFVIEPGKTPEDTVKITVRNHHPLVGGVNVIKYDLVTDPNFPTMFVAQYNNFPSAESAGSIAFPIQLAALPKGPPRRRVMI